MPQTRRKSRAKVDRGWLSVSSITQGRIQQTFEKLRLAIPDLSKAERRVSSLIIEGYQSIQIADYLAIREHTVENHRSSIRKKLNLTRECRLRKELIAIVCKEGE